MYTNVGTVQVAVMTNTELELDSELVIPFHSRFWLQLSFNLPYMHIKNAS